MRGPRMGRLLVSLFMLKQTLDAYEILSKLSAPYSDVFINFRENFLTFWDRVSWGC